jgi:transcriptional regulator with XRE-family HTH domain
MASHRLENYLRTYRRKSGLTQREVAFLLGWKSSGQLSRYEKRHTLPPLRTALAYEAIFKVPLAELFAGIRQGVDQEIRERVDKLHSNLQGDNGSRRQRFFAARKRAWLSEHHQPTLSRHV